MSQTSSRLALPFIQAAQAQKHVTHNEALRALDVLVQLSFQDDAQSAPPASPDEGDCYIVTSGASGAWSGQEGQIAVWLDGAWQFQSAQAGWAGLVLSKGSLVYFDGAAWQPLSFSALNNMAELGLGAQASTTNPFTAELNSALWTARYATDGGSGDLIQALNKEAPTNDAGLMLQTGFQTSALIGLFGDNRLRLSVTADGSAFADGLSIDPVTGIADQPTLPRFSAYTNFDNYVGVGAWTKIAINSADYNDQAAFDAATNLFTAPVEGTYVFGASLTYKTNGNAGARMQGRMVLNGTSVLRGGRGEVSGTHLSEETTLPLGTLVSLNAGDTVELQGNFRSFDGYIMADESAFWGHKVG